MSGFITFISKLRKIILNQTPILTITALILGTVFALGLQIILAWTGPTAPPPGGVLPTKQYIDTSTNAQTKKGSLTIGGSQNLSNLTVQGDIKTIQGGITSGGAISGSTDITSGGSITVGSNITAQGGLTLGGKGDVDDIFLRSIGKWASDRSVSYDLNCTGLRQLGTGCPDSSYVITDVTDTGFICCQADLPGPPPPPYPLYRDYFNVVYECQAVGQNTLYTGKAKLRFVDADGNGISNVKLKGNWSGATTLCNNDSPTCPEAKTIDSDTPADKGTVNFTSKQMIDVDIYGKQFCFNIASNQIILSTSAQLQPPSPPWQACSTTISQKPYPYSYISSIEMKQSLNPQTSDLTATVTVTIVNENKCPLDGITVAGHFLKPFNTNITESITSNGGKATFTNIVKCYDLPQTFSFKVDNVYNGPPYENHGNESIERNYDYPCKKKTGEPCSSPIECNSGKCVDGVCCNIDCSGTCQQCNKIGSIGTCTVRLANDNTKCGTCQSCDGSNTTCQLVAIGQEGKNCTTCAECDGSGSCTAAPNTSCGANLYGCTGTTYFCSSGSCVSGGANGQSCSADVGCCSSICGTDADNDGYFSQALGHTGTCQATAKPYTDCYDANANAYPGQTSYFTSHRGDGSFDYNCDGAITKSDCSGPGSCSQSGAMSCWGFSDCTFSQGTWYTSVVMGATVTKECGVTWTKWGGSITSMYCGSASSCPYMQVGKCSSASVKCACR